MERATQLGPGAGVDPLPFHGSHRLLDQALSNPLILTHTSRHQRLKHAAECRST